MDPISLIPILQAALSANAEERKGAEAHLVQAQTTPGLLPSLLALIVRPDVDPSVRQVAAIQWKNIVVRKWNPSRAGGEEAAASLLPAADVAVVREQLLEAIAVTPPQIRSQLAEGAKSIVHGDFPEAWPSLLPAVAASLQVSDQSRVHAALLLLRAVARKYEFKDEEDRAPLQVVVSSTFPLLLPLLQQLLSIENPPIELAEYIKLILKIFWSTCSMHIPPLLHEEASFLLWMSCLHSCIQRPVPLEGQPAEGEQRKAWGWWKVKKWALHIANRLYHRFGDSKYAKGSNKPFALMFERTVAIKFMEANVALLGALRGGGYLPDRVINLSLQYLTYSISKKGAYETLKPHLQVLLFEIVFPLLCFSEADADLWRDDPQEYVRKGYDIIEDMYSARTAAINFIAELVTKRSKDNLDPFITAVVQLLQRYEQTTPAARSYREKDGSLLALGALSEKLKKTERYKSQLETMLTQHVLPEFKSPVGHLRAKAAWVCGQYADVAVASPPLFSAALNSIVAALRDPDLPVRVDSVVALRSFIEETEDLSELRAILPQLLEEMFKLMNEVENEDLVFSLEVLVEKFGEEMAPFALLLVQNLAALFWKCMRSSDDADAAAASDNADDDDDAGALAAVGCLRAISTILESVSSLPHLYPQMEPAVMPILLRMLTSEGQDVYEEVLEIASYISYYGSSISPQMWQIWPLILTAIDEFAIDFFDNALGPLDNLISRSTDHFLTCPNPNYPDSLFKMLHKILSDENNRDHDVVAAPKLMEAVLQNCRGRVDHWVEPYLQLTLQRLRKTKNNFLKDLLIQVIANSLYYNAPLTLSILQRMGVVGEVFQAWLQMLYAEHKSKKPVHFKREHDKKVCILGLLSLLSVPSASLPTEIQSGLDRVLMALLKLLSALKEQRAAAIKEAEADDEEGDDDDDDDEDWEELDGAEDGGDDDEGVETSKLKAFAEKASRLLGDDDDSDDDFTDEEEFMSPIDSVDPFIHFADTMSSLSNSNGQLFQSLMSSLDFQHQAMAHAIAQIADEQRRKINDASQAS